MTNEDRLLELQSIIDEARESGDYQAAMRGIELIAKMPGIVAKSIAEQVETARKVAEAKSQGIIQNASVFK